MDHALRASAPQHRKERTIGTPNVLSEPKFLGFCAQGRGHNAITAKKDKGAASDLDLPKVFELMKLTHHHFSPRGLCGTMVGSDKEKR